MWLTSSSVGRKFIMAITGACLVLFVTFHCLMNAVAICWPAAYNSVCEFLGANWYALIASAGLAVLIIIHIIYAVMLTIQNRRARGHERYLISRRPASVEWSSKNMFVLGVVILAFLIVHLIQFWAKMQLVEICGIHGEIPPAAGTLFLQQAFSCIWTPIVYIIGFVALWFHFSHGFWSMFQSVGWDSTLWIPRWKRCGQWWATIVCGLFVVQAIVFTVKANENFYKQDPALRDQYKAMLAPVFEESFGADAANAVDQMPYETFSQQMRVMSENMNRPEVEAYQVNNPEFGKQKEVIKNVVSLLDYLEEGEVKDQNPAGMPPM